MTNPRKRRSSSIKARVARVVGLRNVQVAILLVVAMIVVLFLVPTITSSSVLYPWFVPLLELVLGGLLVVIAIMNHLDAEVQRVRDEAGLEHTGRLLPRRKKEAGFSWFFSINNVYNGISLAYLALKAYIVLLAKEGYLSFSLDNLAIQLKLSKTKEDLTTLLAMACEEGLLVALPDTGKYMIIGMKDKNISIKKDVKQRLDMDQQEPRIDRSSRRPSRPARKR
ncbi:MAG TPA: hypothetical protein VKM55_27955 [Candidatus Lokiarchaeia archaeon]|nr:hypothetical protein [Candidatus Lokiarchaeia archaeon]